MKMKINNTIADRDRRERRGTIGWSYKFRCGGATPAKAVPIPKWQRRTETSYWRKPRARRNTTNDYSPLNFHRRTTCVIRRPAGSVGHPSDESARKSGMPEIVRRRVAP